MPSYLTTLDPATQFQRRREPARVRTCAMLLNFPDEPGAGGLHLVPDAARSLPTVSKDGRTYTFTIRPGMRFSPPSNQLVTAQTFKHTIERSFNPQVSPRAAPLPRRRRRRVRVPEGQDRHIAGIRARGRRLTIRLTDRDPEVPGELTVPLFCAVPTDTPDRPISDSDPVRRPVLRRLDDSRTELRPAPQPQLPRRPPAPAPADRGGRRRAARRSPRSRRRSSTTRSAACRPATPPGSSASTGRTAPPRDADRSGISSTARRNWTSST